MILSINGIISVSRGCGYADADVCAFITSANITDTTQKNAINQLVLDLKSANIWSKMKAIYPFVGGTASSHKFNLKDPRDLNASFRLVFNGGWTHSNTGALPNGSNAYADTFFRPFTHLINVNSAHFAKYNRTNDLVGTKIDGVYENSSNTAFQYAYSIGYTNLGNFSSGISYTPTDARGFFTTSRTSSTSVKAYRNAIQQGSTNTATNTTMPNKNVVLGARNDDDVAQYFYNTYEAAFFSLGDGLSDAEVANFYTAVQTFQTTLGRQVGVPIVADSDAQAFLNAAVITDTTQANAINTLVTDLKSANIWSKMKAIYPFVGGTASSHKFNLKDPRDLDAAYRLVFSGGWTHSSTGALPNGTNAYADTKLTPNSLSLSSAHFSKYNRTNDLSGNKIDGTANTTYSSFFQHNYTSANAIVGVLGSMISYTPTDTRGFFISTRTSNVVVKAFRNNSQLGSTNTSFSYELPNQAFYLGARNDGLPSIYNNYESAFASIGDGLSDTEATALYNAVQTFQTTLGRQV